MDDVLVATEDNIERHRQIIKEALEMLRQVSLPQA
jgi:hypothetical protein